MSHDMALPKRRFVFRNIIGTFSQRPAKRDNGSDQIIRVHQTQGLIFEDISAEEFLERREQRRQRNLAQIKENISRTITARENDFNNPLGQSFEYLLTTTLDYIVGQLRLRRIRRRTADAEYLIFEN
jgi:hypothetical protein